MAQTAASPLKNVQNASSVLESLDLIVNFETEFFASANQKVLIKSKKKSIAVFLSDCIHDLKLRLMTVSSRHDSETVISDPRKWFVLNDYTVDPTHPESILSEDRAEPIRIVSKLYPAKSSLIDEHILGIFSRLRRGKFGGYEFAKNVMKIELNGGTQFRVNIGQSHSTFPVPTLRRTAILTTIMERDIDYILDDHVGYMRESPQARSNTNNEFWTSQNLQNDLSAICEALKEADSAVEIANLMCPTLGDLEPEDHRHYYKYDYYGASNSTSTGLDPSQQVSGAIGFRQHHGSVNGVEMLNWIKFLIALVSFAHVVSDDLLDQIIAAKASGRFGLMELFAAMTIISPDTPIPDDFVRHVFKRLEARGFQIEPVGVAGRTRGYGLRVEDWLPADVLGNHQATDEASQTLGDLGHMDFSKVRQGNLPATDIGLV